MARLGLPELSLLAALAVPSISEAQTGSHLPIGGLSTEIRERSTFIVNNTTIAQQCGPKWEETAARYGYDSYRSPSGACYAWEAGFRYYVAEQVEGGYILAPVEGGKNACIQAVTYSAQFDKGEQHFVVLDPSEILSEGLACPQPEPILPAPSLAYGKDKLPSKGTFETIKMEVLQEATYLLPEQYDVDSSRIPAQYRKPPYTVVEVDGKYNVYKEYHFSSIAERGGKTVLESAEDDCLVTLDYELGRVLPNGAVQFFLSPTYVRDADCPVDEVVAHGEGATNPKQTEAPHSAEPARFTASVLAGVDEEELSSTSLGTAGVAVVTATVQPWGNLPLGTGAIVSGVISDEGSGLQGASLGVGYTDSRVTALLTGGGSFEPRAPESSLNGALSLGIYAQTEVYSRGPWGVNCGVQADLQLYGGGVLPLHGFVACGGSWDLVLKKANSNERAPEAPEARFELKMEPYAFPEADRLKTETMTPVLVAEHTRLQEEMKEAAGQPDHKKAIACFHKMERAGMALDPLDYERAMTSAEAMGDQMELYRLAKLYLTVNPEKAQAVLTEIETNYSAVELIVDTPLPSTLSLTVDNPPFEQNKNLMLTFASEQLRAKGRVTVLLPLSAQVGTYHLGELSFKVEKGQVSVIKIDGDFSKEAAEVPPEFSIQTQGYHPEFYNGQERDEPMTPEDTVTRSRTAEHLKEDVDQKQWITAKIDFERLMNFNQRLTAEEYFWGAEAYFYTGDIRSAYDVLLLAKTRGDAEGLDEMLTMIEKNYASVRFTIANKKPFTVQGVPQNEWDKESLREAQADILSGGGTSVLLPISLGYSVDGHPLELKPLAEGHNTYWVESKAK